MCFSDFICRKNPLSVMWTNDLPSVLFNSMDPLIFYDLKKQNKLNQICVSSLMIPLSQRRLT